MYRIRRSQTRASRPVYDLINDDGTTTPVLWCEGRLIPVHVSDKGTLFLEVSLPVKPIKFVF